MHAKFEDLYDEAAAHIDDIAERILTLDAKSVATIKEYLEITSIKEATGKESSDEMVQSILNDYTSMINDLKSGIDIANAQGDKVTQPICY